MRGFAAGRSENHDFNRSRWRRAIARPKLRYSEGQARLLRDLGRARCRTGPVETSLSPHNELP